jgi:hypothetical protein
MTWLLLVLLSCVSVVNAQSQNPAEGTAAPTTAPAPPQPQQPTPAPSAPGAGPATAPRKAQGGKRAGEKEAEGTQAPNRFQADTVIKSQYKLDGQPLEVDPD